ncbi:MAG TPA: copper homeostasis protein CutC [Anaerolineaceae bacterium]
MKPKILFEACVDSVDAAVAAQAGGADRVELCADLLEGGCTPSPGTILLARQRLQIKMHVIIRPRGGDFCFSDVEFETMKLDIAFAKQAGADGVVIGILNPDGTVDEPRTRALIEAARPMSVTFHRAFDMTRDPFEALETLIRLGVDRVLTSGQEASVLEGLDLICELVQRAGDRITVMPGGGITERNIQKIVTASGVKEVHAAALSSIDGKMQFRNPRCFMGGELRPPEFALSITEPARINALVQALGKGG